MTRKKVMVLGGAGFIGSHTCLALADNGYEPVIVDNFSNGSKELCLDFHVEDIDILDTASLSRAMITHQPEAVIHFAALIEVGESIKNPDAFFRNNIAGTHSVLNAMRAANVGKIVFSSTAAVYGQPETELPLTEDIAWAPINPYGYSKLAAEWIIRSYDAAYGIKSVCLRYFNACGADPMGRIGEAHYPESHLIPLIIQTALGMREKISVFGTDYPTRDGTCIRDYIHVSDLAQAHIKAFEYLAKGGATEYCNLGTSKGYSVNEIIDAVRHAGGKHIAVDIADRRSGDPAFLVANNQKAQVLLDWQPRFQLVDIIKDAYQWHQSDQYRDIWERKKSRSK